MEDTCVVCGAILVNDICPYCRFVEVFQETIENNIPRFINLEILGLCLVFRSEKKFLNIINEKLLKLKRKKKPWLYYIPYEFQFEYLNQLWKLKQAFHNKGPNISGSYNVEIINEILSKIKKVYYPKSSRNHFDPRKDGNYCAIFNRYNDEGKYILTTIKANRGLLIKCHRCGTFGDIDFFVKENSNKICIGCISEFRTCDFSICRKIPSGVYTYKEQYKYLCSQHYQTVKERGHRWRKTNCINKPESE